jgi:hypothetical protein
MKNETWFWTAVMLLGAVCLGGRALLVDGAPVNGARYVREVRVDPEDGPPIVNYAAAPTVERNDPDVSFSLPRTIGIWVAAFCTIALFSFLYKDNPLYKLAEAVFIGMSAGYAMVVGFWNELVQNLLGRLVPDLMRASLLPGIVQEPDYWYLVPLILGIMMLWRLSPVGGWIARWPLAFFIGATAGFRLVGFLEADFARMISSTILPLIVIGADRSFDLWASVKNCIIVFGVLTCLVYFSFSIEHSGAVGLLAKLGIWVLMIAFGASFGYTVMGRVALLAARLEFLFDDWLWLIDPLGLRADM